MFNENDILLQNDYSFVTVGTYLGLSKPYLLLFMCFGQITLDMKIYE